MKVTVCIGSSCHIKGSRRIVEEFQNLIKQHHLEDQIELSGTICLGKCRNGVCVTIDGHVYSVAPDSAAEFFETEIQSRLSG